MASGQRWCWSAGQQSPLARPRAPLSPSTPDLNRKGVLTLPLPPSDPNAQKRLLVLTAETCAQKHDPWEGGVRTTAFISGGFVPAALRGTTSGAKFVHISDW